MAGRAQGPWTSGNAGQAIAQEAARIVVDESVLDYRSAKQKAAQRLGLGPRATLPDNAAIEAAVIEYQRLFGGRDYAEHLRGLRGAAVQAMRLLAAFEPRLVGATVSGAINQAHRVQLHAFADKPEAVEMFLLDRGIACRQDDRSYRYPDGSEEMIPLARFEAGDIGVDVAVFDLAGQRRAPLSPFNGLPTKRLSLVEAETLARINVEDILGPAA